MSSLTRATKVLKKQDKLYESTPDCKETLFEIKKAITDMESILSDTDVDKGKLEKCYAEGMDCITLQCADENVYRTMNDELITGQKIFMYMDTSDGVVAYSQNEEQYSLSFWLSE